LTAADVPELAEFVANGQVDGDLLMNPYEDFALKPDGTPFRIPVVTACLVDEW
jgi:hypothetical protein